jgi:hypothetical protein
MGFIQQDYVWIIETGDRIGHIQLHRVDLRDRRTFLAAGIDDVTRLGQGLGQWP